MSRKHFLKIQQLAFRFSHKECFSGFNAEVIEGDRIVLIGENGSGKTSLLRCLTGEEDTYEGDVCWSSDALFAYMPQSFTQEGSQTVLEAVQGPIQSILADLNLSTSQDIDTYQELYDRLLLQEAFSAESRVERVLEEMELTSMRTRPCNTLSGGERMRVKLAQSLVKQPQLLILDEPTNHLDSSKREWVHMFLDQWKGAAIIVTHDLDILHRWPNKVWALGNGKIDVFDGCYADYIEYAEWRTQQQEEERQELIQKQKVLVRKSQNEETRRARTAVQSKKRYSGDKLTLSSKRGRAEKTQGRSDKKKNAEEKSVIRERIRELNRPKKVIPRFHYKKGADAPFYIRIEDGTLKYGSQTILKAIHMGLYRGDRIAIVGPNGGGKTTFFRALMGDKQVVKQGVWDIPDSLSKRIGYLDQHHQMLDENKTMMESLQRICPEWSQDAVRRHLSGFLFYDQRTWKQTVDTLSQGEKMRLALALIAANTPDMLILDEATNHLDITTKMHLAEVLNAYEGALIVNSHEKEFLREIGVETIYEVVKGGSIRCLF